MISLERRVLKAVIDQKLCPVTPQEYDDLYNKSEAEMDKWMSQFVPTRFRGAAIKLVIV